MIELIDDELVVSFSSSNKNEVSKIYFERFVKVDQYISLIEKNCPYLSNKGRLSLRSINELSDKVSQSLLKKGGLALSVSKHELLSITIESNYPVAIKIAKNDMNVLSGQKWNPDLLPDKRDYLISNLEPWLDDYRVGTSSASRFIEISEGSNDEQYIGDIKIFSFPMKVDAYNEIKEITSVPRSMLIDAIDDKYFGVDAWDTTSVSSCSVYCVKNEAN